MRHTVVAMLLVLGGCAEDEPEPSGPPVCEDCAQAEGCPGDQPNQNPLEPCDEMDATCYYCGPQTRRYVCGPTANGELRWQDDGVADMCPPPPEPMTGSGGA